MTTSANGWWFEFPLREECTVRYRARWGKHRNFYFCALTSRTCHVFPLPLGLWKEQNECFLWRFSAREEKSYQCIQVCTDTNRSWHRPRTGWEDLHTSHLRTHLCSPHSWLQRIPEDVKKRHLAYGSLPLHLDAKKTWHDSKIRCLRTRWKVVHWKWSTSGSQCLKTYLKTGARVRADLSKTGATGLTWVRFTLIHSLLDKRETKNVLYCDVLLDTFTPWIETPVLFVCQVFTKQCKSTVLSKSEEGGDFTRETHPSQEQSSTSQIPRPTLRLFSAAYLRLDSFCRRTRRDIGTCSCRGCPCTPRCSDTETNSHTRPRSSRTHPLHNLWRWQFWTLQPENAKEQMIFSLSEKVDIFLRGANCLLWKSWHVAEVLIAHWPHCTQLFNKDFFLPGKWPFGFEKKNFPKQLFIVYQFDQTLNNKDN